MWHVGFRRSQPWRPLSIWRGEARCRASRFRPLEPLMLGGTCVPFPSTDAIDRDKPIPKWSCRRIWPSSICGRPFPIAFHRKYRICGVSERNPAMSGLHAIMERHFLLELQQRDCFHYSRRILPNVQRKSFPEPPVERCVPVVSLACSKNSSKSFERAF